MICRGVALLLAALALAIVPASPASAHVSYVPTLRVGVFEPIYLPVRAEEVTNLTKVEFFLPEGMQVRSATASRPPWTGSVNGSVVTFENGNTPQLEFGIFTLEAFYPTVGVVSVPFTATYADGLERPHLDTSPVAPYPMARVDVVDPNVVAGNVNTDQGDEGSSADATMRLLLVGGVLLGGAALIGVFRRRF